MSLADIVGATGVFLLLLAFVLAGLKKIKADGILYFVMNTTGAGLACYASWLINYTPFIILEGAWTIASLVGLIRTLRQLQN